MDSEKIIHQQKQYYSTILLKPHHMLYISKTTIKPVYYLETY